MSALSADARAQIKGAGITIRAYVRDVWHDGKWHGDSCGCTDDRCIGYHHDVDDDCGCLRVLIEEKLAEQLGI